MDLAAGHSMIAQNCVDAIITDLALLQRHD
jgi:hypothetical protein